ncbi:MAG: DUF2844 domain-containing protein [Betaproteobacteria bacterium]
MKFCLWPKRRMAAALAMSAAFVALPASAALGGDAVTIDADAAQLQGRMKIARVQRYAVHEIESPHGTVVREYVSPAGKVFGVAWNGPTLPDLRQVLGPYFDTYVEAVRKRAARGPVQIAVPGLVVQSSGHMRAFVGSAYLPEGLPQGVAAEEVR